MQCRMQEHKRVGGNVVGNGGEQPGREGWDTADDSTLWKEGWDAKGVGENREGLEVTAEHKKGQNMMEDAGGQEGGTGHGG